MKSCSMWLCILLLCVCALNAAEPTTLYGHKRYEELSAHEVVQAGVTRSGRVIFLQKNAAAAFTAMQKAAQKDDVKLILISGYRSVAYQNGLFERAIKRYGSPEKASRWVAPPGYSEHHTGRAIDIGDRNVPNADLEVTFEKTPAYRWLLTHAEKFHFVLSFPQVERVSPAYEPWHWCYHITQKK